MKTLRSHRAALPKATVIAAMFFSGSAGAADTFPTAEVPTSVPAYIAKAKTAAPESIVSDASIVMMQDGKQKEVQSGKNGFTCLVLPDGSPACADKNSMEWLQALMEKKPPPDKIGFMYMLAGDTGTTNHDPYATDTHRHWVQTGPHVMVVGPRVKEMVGYSRALDVHDPHQPYVMFPGTPYEHLMLPTH